MHEDRLHALDGGASVAAGRARFALPRHDGTQSVAVCEVKQVVAAANGRFVDLYGLSSGSSPLRLTFLTQIALDDYVSYLPAESHHQHKCRGSDNSHMMVATCVCFPIPGVLLVGAASVDDQASVHDGEASRPRYSTAQNASILPDPNVVLGFRVYPSLPMRYMPPTVAGVPERPIPPPLQVHFSFLEPIVGVAKSAIRTLQSCHEMMTPDSGSVVLLFDDCNAFGVLTWTERFSDRRVCLAELKQRPDALTAATVSPSGRILVLADTTGRLSFLDCSRLAWGNARVSLSVEGRRLQLGVCSRSGVVVRDNPLDEVRLVHTAGGVDSGSGTTSVRWWRCDACAGGKDFILVGKRDGSLSVFQVLGGSSNKGPGCAELKFIQMYPGLLASKHDAIRSISVPSKSQGCLESLSPNSEWFEFCTISDTRWRVWRVKVGHAGRSPHQGIAVGWPSLKESLGFPALTFMTKEVKGVAILSGTTVFSRSVGEAFANAKPGEAAQHPITLMLAEGRLQFIARLAKVSSTVQGSLESECSSSSSFQSNDQAKDDGEDELEEKHVQDAGNDINSSDAKRLPPAATTIQDKYRLPPMEWTAKGTGSEASHEPETNTVKTSSNQEERTNTLGPAKISRAEYDERVAAVVQRIGDLSTTLKTMRTSFGLFSQDVQQHMNTITEQLEEMTRRAVADKVR